ncbi:MAG TPA: TetR family transcriptional regulator [Solirubrobacteraceae bacterium]|nr:TetR family transcriptional regulator [Solirubrobacteraceae bacterium]
MSSPPNTARRKPPEARRTEIMQTAASIALTDGLDKVTARRVADALGVFPGLINHYFRSADELVAAAFAHAAARETDEVLSYAETAATPVEQIARLLRDWLDSRHDSVSLLWLDAWQASRRRPALLNAVTEQMKAQLTRLETLIRAGNDSDDLHVADAAAAALQIMALIDATSVQAAIRTKIDYTPVSDMAIDTAENILGIPQGALRP